jgi:hypothetical protein
LTRLARLGVCALGALVVAGLGSLAWRQAACAGFGKHEPAEVKRLHGEGPVRAGAGRVAFVLPEKAIPAGYGPPRELARAEGSKLFARAVVFESGTLRVGLVSLDLLLVPERLAADIRARAESRGLAGVLIAATHAHSSVGGFDDRLVSEIAALGRFHPEIEQAIVDAADQAIAEAEAQQVDAPIGSMTRELPALERSRDDGLATDPRFTRIVIGGPKPSAQIVLMSAHPTLVDRHPVGLEGDYPSRVAVAEEKQRSLITLFLQSAVGNASAQVPEGKGPPVHRFAIAVYRALQKTPVQPEPASALSFVEVTAPLPRPDSRRLVVSPLRPLGDALLCETAPKRFTLTALRVGGVTLLGVPGEPTAEVAHALEQASGARVVALSGGYLGYLDTPEHVKAGQGEGDRQYFGPELYDALIDAAKATRQ